MVKDFITARERLRNPWSPKIISDVLWVLVSIGIVSLFFINAVR